MGVFDGPADLGTSEVRDDELARVAVQLDAFAADLEPQGVGDCPGRCTAAGTVPATPVAALASCSPPALPAGAGSPLAGRPLAAGAAPAAPIAAAFAGRSATPLTTGPTAPLTTRPAAPLTTRPATPLTTGPAAALATRPSAPFACGAAASSRATLAPGRCRRASGPGLLCPSLALATTAPPTAPPSATATLLAFNR